MIHCHEFSAPVWVQTPLGPGRMLLLYDYGLDHNGVAFVQLDNGQFKYCDTNDLRSFENLTLGIPLPNPPEKTGVIAKL